MISKIRIANFGSIGKEIELNFTKGGRTEESGYFKLKDTKISLLNGFYGANASGKSNTLKAFNTLVRIMYNVIPKTQSGFQDPVLLFPNFHSDFKDLPTKLGFDFLIGKNNYKYDLEILSGKKIAEEKLFVIDTNLKSAKPKEVFTRRGDGIKFGPDFKDHDNYFLAISIAEYQTVISHLIVSNARAVLDFIEFGKNNKYFAKTDEIDAMIPGVLNIIQQAMRMKSSSNPSDAEMNSITRSVLSRFDKTIESIDIDTSNNNVSIKIAHKEFYDKVDIMQESSGTRELFLYIYDILRVLKNGGVIIYDETNRYFHPDIENILISLFNNKEVNSSNAQLFFASHNYDTLESLNLDQIFIVEKNNNSSIVTKVSEIEDIKSRDNLKKKYSLGFLGGLPDSVDFSHMIKQII